MRKNNAFKNMISALIVHFLSMGLGFISQAIFVRTLGTEYLGINGLFNNIFSMLSVVELGIGSAIIYNLYKPVAKNDNEQIKSLMQFYKKCYRAIAIIIFLLSILLIPFLTVIVGKTTISNKTIIIIYLLFMIDIVCSYLLTYKRSILYANQKNYIIDIVHIFYLFFLNSIQILILLNSKNYLFYLSFKILMRLLENLILTFIANKKYPYLMDKQIYKIEKSLVNNIIKKVKGLFIHKIGVFLVAGTDNLIISTFLGVNYVGLYSNYFMIINSLNTLIGQIFASLKSSVGNLIVTSSKDKVYDIYKKMQFLNFWLAMISSVGIFVVMESFIKVWVGEQYILSKYVLLVLTINNYVYITKLCISSFKEAAGIFYEDRIVPIIESVVNISLSIVFLKLFGLAGVFMGTIMTYLITHVYTYPKIVYKKIFDKKYGQYFKDIYIYIFTTIIACFITYIISINIVFNNDLIQILFNVLLTLIIPNILVVLIFHNKEEFNYYLDMLRNIIRKFKKINRKKK